MPTAAELLPAGAWVVLTQAARTQDRARAAHQEAEALAAATAWPGPPVIEPSTPRSAGTCACTCPSSPRIDLGIEPWGSAQGNAAELAKRFDGCGRAATG
ncbi:MAG: hypothetical protein U0V56_09515 [Actinomycetota bacterium]